jgi:hypothetical protein
MKRSATGFLLIVVAGCLHEQPTPTDNVAQSRALEVRAEDGQSSVSTVRAEDIPDRVQIIGSLGRPLGEMVTIRGKWWDPGRRTKGPPPKDMTPRFRVTEVNGERLVERVTFRRELIRPVDVGGGNRAPDPEDGATWELRGVQMGGFRYVPDHAWKEALETNGPDYAPGGIDHAYGFHFVTDFHYVSCKVVEATEQTE